MAIIRPSRTPIDRNSVKICTRTFGWLLSAAAGNGPFANSCTLDPDSRIADTLIPFQNAGNSSLACRRSCRSALAYIRATADEGRHRDGRSDPAGGAAPLRNSFAQAERLRPRLIPCLSYLADKPPKFFRHSPDLFPYLDGTYSASRMPRISSSHDTTFWKYLWLHKQPSL